MKNPEHGSVCWFKILNYWNKLLKFLGLGTIRDYANTKTNKQTNKQQVHQYKENVYFSRHERKTLSAYHNRQGLYKKIILYLTDEEMIQVVNRTWKCDSGYPGVIYILWAWLSEQPYLKNSFLYAFASVSCSLEVMLRTNPWRKKNNTGRQSLVKYMAVTHPCCILGSMTVWYKVREQSFSF